MFYRVSPFTIDNNSANLWHVIYEYLCKYLFILLGYYEICLLWRKFLGGISRFIEKPTSIDEHIKYLLMKNFTFYTTTKKTNQLIIISTLSFNTVKCDISVEEGKADGEINFIILIVRLIYLITVISKKFIKFKQRLWINLINAY